MWLWICQLSRHVLTAATKSVLSLRQQSVNLLWIRERCEFGKLIMLEHDPVVPLPIFAGSRPPIVEDDNAAIVCDRYMRLHAPIGAIPLKPLFA